MAYWLFNSNKIKDLGNNNYSFSQKRKFRGKIGDYIIFYDLGSKSFTEITEIKKVTNSLSIGNEELIFEINVKNVKTINEKIDEYLYSLQRIKKVKKGVTINTRFNSLYYSIERVEYEAIKNSEIYRVRTILGLVYDSLPEIHQKQYFKYLMCENPKLFLEDNKHELALDRLQSYFDIFIKIPANQIKNSFDEMKELFGAQQNFYFGQEDSEVVYDVEKQVNIINENIDGIDLKEEYLQQREFNSLFKNIPLPIY